MTLFEIIVIPSQALHYMLLLSKIMPVDKKMLAPDKNFKGDLSKTNR